jgi:hypothetical protein
MKGRTVEYPASEVKFGQGSGCPKTVIRFVTAENPDPRAQENALAGIRALRAWIFLVPASRHL